MEYMRGLDGLYLREETAVTLGKFDGLHLGHQQLLQRILKRDGLKSVMFAVSSDRPGQLLTAEEKRDMLEKSGLSCLIDCPFTPGFSRMEAEAFVREILVKRLHARYIAIGSDFRFGYQRRGDAALLTWLQDRYGFQTEVIEKETYEGRVISSTLVKEALSVGNMELVEHLLGYPYFVTGEVVHGRRLGRTLGMPTANVIPTIQKALPPNGVYISRTWIDKGSFPGITNIGRKPTVGSDCRGVETYLFDFDGDLYGKTITVELLRHTRPEIKFDSVEALRAQMQRDMSSGKEFFGE